MKDEFRDFEDAPAKRKKRWLSFLAFVAFYLIVGAVLVEVFAIFTHSWLLAIVLVGFMTVYMGVMGWVTMRKAEDKDV